MLQVLNTNLTAMLNYDRKIGTDHTLGVTGWCNQRNFKAEDFQAYRRNYISPAIDQLFAGGATQTADKIY